MGLIDNVRAGGYEAVVLQGVYTDNDIAAAVQVSEIVRSQGGRLLLYQRFSGPRESAADTERYAQQYKETARAAGAELVPVGDAWEKAKADRPGISLYHDGGHASIAGGYLIAATFYSFLTGASAEGHPEPAALVGQARLPRELADWLAKLAFEACEAQPRGQRTVSFSSSTAPETLIPLPVPRPSHAPKRAEHLTLPPV
jgi:hypothetical protein